jgi:hypothetical protein
MRKKKLKLRSATLLDLEIVYNLMVQQNMVDFDSALLSIEDLRQRWQVSDFSLNEYSQIAFSADEQLLVYAEIKWIQAA